MKSESSLKVLRAWFLLGLVSLLGACRSQEPSPARGSLLLIGGGLDNDSREIWERFVQLATQDGVASIVIASAATGEEDVEITDKTEALRVWAPHAKVSAIRRATSTEETVARLDEATAVFFTGGDQKRITARYRPDDCDTPEWLAMQRLLARGGVIAGGSAGDAMMGMHMLLGGGSAAALRDGAQIGPGMRLQPWVFTDSHFFERDRLGRLVAALHASGQRLGLGVGEDACVEVDLASGELRGVTSSESLVVDTAHMVKQGTRWTGLLAMTLGRGETLSLPVRLTRTPSAPSPRPTKARSVPVVEPGQNRQLASWRMFKTPKHAPDTAEVLQLEGWAVTAWAGPGVCVTFELDAP